MRGELKAIDTRLSRLERKFSIFEDTLTQMKSDISADGWKVGDLEVVVGKVESLARILDDEVGELADDQQKNY